MRVVYLVEKRPEFSDDAFVKHWTTTHAGFAARMPGLRDYTINYPSPLQRGVRPVDGYAVLGFDSYDSVARAWNTPQGQATAADAQRFLARARHLIVEEVPVLRDGRAVAR